MFSIRLVHAAFITQLMFMNFCHNIEKELASGISIWTPLVNQESLGAVPGLLIISYYITKSRLHSSIYTYLCMFTFIQPPGLDNCAKIERFNSN